MISFNYRLFIFIEKDLETIFGTSDFFSQLIDESMKIEGGDILFVQLVDDPKSLIQLIDVS